MLTFEYILLLFLIVMYQTQIVQGSEYRARSMASNADEEVVEASRGTITDRNGKVLDCKVEKSSGRPWGMVSSFCMGASVLWIHSVRGFPISIKSFT